MTQPSGSPTVHVHLLGGFRVEVDGRPVPDSAWQRKSAKMLVKLLAVEPGHRLHREQIMDLLWPEASCESALNSLGKALHAARDALQIDRVHGAPSRYVHLHDDIVVLDPLMGIDADEFERQAAVGLTAGDPASLERAISLYGGELLPEDRYAPWAQGRREALSELHIRVLLKLGTVHEATGNVEYAAERYQRVLLEDPVHEDAHRGLMRAYARAGNRHAALRQFEACRRIVQHELEVEPDGETVMLAGEILAGRFPPSARGRFELSPEARDAREQPSDGTTNVAPVPWVLHQAVATPLVGRDRALDLLRGDLERAAAGQGGTTLVGGEAGVGKTRLAIEAARIARDLGFAVMWSTATDLESDVPYGIFTRAVEEHAHALAAGKRRDLMARHPELRAIFPSFLSDNLAETGASTPYPLGPPTGSPTRLHAACAALLATVQDGCPLVLVLDDLHHADAESMRLLLHLARLALGQPWIILGTYREEDVVAGSTFQRLSSLALREGIWRQIDLWRLSQPDTDRLVRAALADGAPESELLSHVFLFSQGNPLFAHELLRALRENGDMTLAEGVWRLHTTRVGIPRQVRDLVDARMGRMDNDMRRVVALAATAGVESDFELLRAAALSAFEVPFDEARLLDALERILDVYILTERTSAGAAGARIVYAFRHPLLREAQYERLSHSRRLRLHDALARGLEAVRPDDVEALAFHSARSGDPVRAAKYLKMAGDRARDRYANKAAASYYRQLIVVLERLGRAPDAAQARDELGQVLLVAGRYDEALSVLEDAAAVYEVAGDVNALARTLALIGDVHGRRGTPTAGLQRLQPLSDALEAEALSGMSPLAAARLIAAQANLLFLTGRYCEQLAAAERAIALVGASDDNPERERMLAEALVDHGTALLQLGRLEEALGALAEAILPAEATRDDHTLFRALTNLASTHNVRGDFVASRPYTERALEVAKRLADPPRIALALTNLGSDLLSMGEWDEAERLLTLAQTTVASVGASQFEPYPLLFLGALRLYQGNDEEARRLLGECDRLARRHGDPLALRRAARLLAECDIRAGRAVDVPGRLEPLLADAATDDPEAVAMLPLLAWSYLEAGDVSRAQSTMRRALSTARRGGHRAALADALRVQGMIASQRRQWKAAKRALDEAVSLAHELSHRYLCAHALHARGLMYAARLELDRAQRDLDEALSIFLHVGAHAEAGRTRSALAAAERETRKSQTSAIDLDT